MKSDCVNIIFKIDCSMYFMKEAESFMRRSLKTIFAAGIFSALLSVSAFAAGWKQTGDVWHYIDDEGNALKGWHNIKEENGDKTYWYYFDPDTGDMATGWREIKEANSDARHYYFFDEVNGAMWVDMVTPDGNYVNADGVWIEEGKPEENASTEETGSQSETSEEQTQAETETVGNDSEGASVDSVQSGEEAYAERLLELLNERRRAEGLPDFKTDEKLAEGARIRAEELTRSYSSLRPDGNKSKYAIDGWENYSALVEIKDRASSPEETAADWAVEGSSEELILSDSFVQGGKTFSFTDIGIGCKEKDGELFFAVFLNGHSD